MNEKSKVITLCIGLIILGLALFALSNIITKFTFYSSEIHSEGNTISETLKYKPLYEEYHTIYRNFLTPIYTQSDQEHISISSVKCSAGIEYYTDINDRFYSSLSSPRFAYTEKNEYGCGFGNNKGFKKGQIYEISAEYDLNAKTLFLYNNQTYIKFVAYSKNSHPLLIKDKNFVVDEDIAAKQIYLTGEDVVVFVKYDPADITQYKIVPVDNLKTSNTSRILSLLWIIIPSMICFLVWNFFGKENIEGDFPEELSQYPKERSAWEVAAFFNAPFESFNETFLATMITDFYNRKIIDIKDIDKTVHIKIIKENPDIDSVEKSVLDFLKKAREMSSSESKEGKNGYFCINTRQDNAKSIILAKSYDEIRKTVHKQRDGYINTNGIGVIIIAMIIASIIAIKSSNLMVIIFYILATIIAIIIAFATSIFSKFKKDLYVEYQQWQGFKNYLSTLDSMKRSPPQGVILWEKYLVYATALRVGKKVLKALRQWKVITQKEFNTYNHAYTYSHIAMISTSAGASSSGSGGFSGGSSGGIGGGGGGGR